MATTNWKMPDVFWPLVKGVHEQPGVDVLLAVGQSPYKKIFRYAARVLKWLSRHALEEEYDLHTYELRADELLADKLNRHEGNHFYALAVSFNNPILEELFADKWIEGDWRKE